MHDIKWIRENTEALKEALRSRNWDAAKVDATVDGILALDDERRNCIAMAQKGQEERNSLSKQIGAAMKSDPALAEALKARVAQLKDDLAAAEMAEKQAVAALDKELLELPNVPLAEVPKGADEHDNIEQRVVGAKPVFPEGFRPREHFEIGEKLGMMDFEAAARMSGARFVVLKGQLARLERALGQFMLDLHTDVNGYTEVNPPILVKDEAMYGTAQLPKFREDQFSVGTVTDMDLAIVAAADVLLAKESREDIERELENTNVADINFLKRELIAKKVAIARAEKRVDQAIRDLWLIPTAEVPLTNLVREQILDEKNLPLRMTALTPCFRAEAGSAGRDTRGMIRQHQFSKVELVSITTPEKSLEEHERMTAAAEEVLKRLGLHYRVVTLCTGDMGFASQKTYDIEVWLPGQDRFREISSCSVCGEFQARRMMARYRPADSKGTRFVHTLNGSGVAVGRALVAVLENYQNPDGSVTVPEALRGYMGGLERIG
jgi:seryl-tRNA synthetase